MLDLPTKTTAIPIPAEQRLLGIKTLAGLFGVHPKTLTRRASEAGIGIVRVSRHDPSIRAGDLEKLLKACERGNDD